MAVPPTFGKRSIESMFAHAAEDRIASERASKNLKLTRSSPLSEYHIALWYNRLTAFRKHTLQIDNPESVTPTGADIERFLAIISNHLQPKGGGAISVSTVQQGVSCLLKGCVFYHPDFKVTAHEGSRIDSLIQTLIRDGRMTYNVKRERNWIGSVIVARLVESTYRHALQNGTGTWDTTIAKVQSIVLHSALGCRVGDISRGQNDQHEMPFLAYGDITMKLDGGSGVEHLCMSVLMRNIKGRKGKPLLNSSKRFYSINSPLESIPLCPVKVIVIMALRLGNVDATNIDELLSATAARHNKTVQWKNANWPVLPRFTKGAAVVPDAPAHSRQLGEILDQVTTLAGIVAKIRGHDLRRGAAKDAAAATMPSLLNEEVAAKEVLSHSYTAMLRGVTKQYIGPSEHDLWKPRVENKHVDIFTAPLTAEVSDPLLTNRQLSSAAINDFCKTYDLDPTIRSQRIKATRKAKAAAHAEWREAQQHATVEPAREIVSVHSDDEEHAGQDFLATTPTTPVTFDDIANPDGEELGELDETNGSASIFSKVMGAGTESDETSSEMAMNALLECVSNSQMNLETTMAPPPRQTGQPSLEEFQTLTPLEFVRHFSTVNLTNNLRIGLKRHDKRAAMLSEMNGNSRNDAAMFQLFCKHRKTNGCMYSTPSPYALEDHEKNCEKRLGKSPERSSGPSKVGLRKRKPESSKSPSQ